MTLVGLPAELCRCSCWLPSHHFYLAVRHWQARMKDRKWSILLFTFTARAWACTQIWSQRTWRSCNRGPLGKVFLQDDKRCMGNSVFLLHFGVITWRCHVPQLRRFVITIEKDWVTKTKLWERTERWKESGSSVTWQSSCFNSGTVLASRLLVLWNDICFFVSATIHWLFSSLQPRAS